MRYKGVDFETVVNVKSDILTMSLNSRGARRENFKKALDFNFEYKSLLYYDVNIAYDINELVAFSGLVEKRLKEDRSYLYKLPNRTYKLADNLLEHAREIKNIRGFKKYSNEELERLFSNLMKKAEAAFPLILISIPVESAITSELAEYIKERSSEFDYYYQSLTQRSTRETFFQKEYRSLLNIGKIVQANKTALRKFKESSSVEISAFLKGYQETLYKRIDSHRKKFGWINMSLFRRNPLTELEVIVRVKDIIDKNCEQELSNLSTKKRRINNNFRKAINNLEIKGELKKKVEILGELVYLRTYRLDIFSLSAYLVRDLLLEIGDRFNFSYDQLTRLTSWEIRELLLGKSGPSAYMVDQRMEDFAVVQIDWGFQVIVDKNKLASIRKKLEDKKTRKVKQVSGEVASKGNAKGQVKIVMNPTQVLKIEKGDVLVAPMTSPDFVMGMLKAVAIVTDHGGITSHAAIVSRELGVPCVVGTKIATKVFKDGDMVEVDAEKGVVKKLGK